MNHFLLGIPGNIGVPVISALIGAVALWPLRRRLGTVGYALCMLPVGLLAWAIVPLLTTLTGTVMRWRVVLPGLLGYTLLVGVTGHALDRDNAPSGTSHVAAPGLAAVATVLLTAGCAWLIYVTGWSIYTVDSWSNYAMYGISIADTGAFTASMMANRALLLPALHAGVAFLGGTWTFVLYPLFAIETAALLGYAVWSTAFAGFRAWVRVCASLLTVALMITTAPFLLHSVYVHSHMVSAMYLLLAVASIWRAFESGTARIAWLTMAGIAAAGLALARPDGFAYAFVVYGVFALVWLTDESERTAAELAAMFAPPTAGAVMVMGVLVSRYGLYQAPERLGAIAAIAVAAAGPSFALLLWLLHRCLRRTRGLSPARLTLTLAALSTVALGASFLIDPERFVQAGSTWLLNLFAMGGWNRFWWFGVAVLVAALVQGSRITRAKWALPVEYAVFQFLALAVLIHGVTHPGRYGWGDSLNRVTFHVVPLLFWLAADLTASLFRRTRADEPER